MNKYENTTLTIYTDFCLLREILNYIFDFSDKFKIEVEFIPPIEKG